MRRFLLIATAVATVLLIAAILVVVRGWHDAQQQERPIRPVAGIPPRSLEAALEAHYRGLGHMERYEYTDAAEQFRIVRELAPDWAPGRINLAIALLNQTGVLVEEAKEAGAEVEEVPRFDESLMLLEEVLNRDPDNLSAHFCAGIILEEAGRWREAAEHFKAVTEGDPDDAHAWFWYGKTMPDTTGEQQASLTEPERAAEVFGRAVALNPDLVPALYALSRAEIRLGHRDEYDRLTERYNRLYDRRTDPPPGMGETAQKRYGEMGHYADVVGPPVGRDAPADDAPDPRFDGFKEAAVRLPDGHRWTSQADFTGARAALGAARQRYGAGVAAVDLDRDGDLDLYLTAALVGPDGLRDALLINEGDGTFVEAAAAWGLPADLASIGVAAADFDADLHPDLYLTLDGPNRLLRNDGDGERRRFVDLTAETGTAGPDALSPMARWLDLDLDGDLDLFVVNHGPAGGGIGGATNVAFRNDGQPVPVEEATALSLAPIANEGPEAVAVDGLRIAFSPWDESSPLCDPEAPHAAVAALDIDSDRDLDLVLAIDGRPLRALLNDRLGAFRGVEIDAPGLPETVSGLLVLDLDKDGRPDLVSTDSHGRAVAWRNATEGRGEALTPALESFPCDADDWRSATVADPDLDGWLDLVGTSIVHAELPTWARNEGDRLSARPLPIAPPETSTSTLLGGTFVDLRGDPLPDPFYVRDGAPPILSTGRGNGNHWLAIALGGRWNVWPKLMRTNPHGIGTTLSIEGAGLHVPFPFATPEAGPSQSIAPFVLGIGDASLAPLIRLRWPDGVIQTEMNTSPDVSLTIEETSRKTGSCPVLFTWNGERYVCIGDFLGGGGMGYLVAPGVYSQPDRDEMVHVRPDQLRPARGAYRLSISEPMDEVAYLDHLVLDVVDRPPGVEAHPDERFSPGGNRPSGELLAWRDTIAPARATDLGGTTDLTATLASFDRETTDGFRRHIRWVGYAEEHGIVLDFGDRLSRYGPDDRLVLCLAGWVEYPYSQTNYAASTAGLALEPPVLERLQPDCSWSVIEADPGYPAGLPRLTTLDLTGRLDGDRCVLRLRTNMECYYDQAFIALRDEEAESSLRVTSLPVATADLQHRGYTREVSPDGRLPLLYDYDYVDPAPLAPFAGRLTRHGNVLDLLTADDDRLCLVGPGDEVRLAFDADGVPDLPDGWTRSYVLRSYGYCKDADPFTAGSDTVGPLPWKGMPEFPFAEGVERPNDPAHQEYLDTYQTRPAGGD